MPKTDIKVHEAVLLPAELLSEHTGNSNKQSRHAFKELRENIREQGFDENLIVRPIGDGSYEVVSGNHRFKAGKLEGMKEFPCVIQENWDQIVAEVQSVRRNYVRGKIDKDLFTAQVNRIQGDHGLLMGDIMERMGFEDPDAFADLYKEEKEIQEKVQQDVQSTSAGRVKMVDDLGMVISGILEKYGDTIPYSFIVFPVGGREHMYVAANNTLKQTLQTISAQCIAQKMDINIALAGLLNIGMSQSSFMGGGAQTVEDAGKDDPDDDAGNGVVIEEGELG